MALTQHELIEDPHDWFATLLRQTAAHLSVSTQFLGSLYLLAHGLVKVGIVVGVWRGYRWVYPVAIGFLGVITFIYHAARNLYRVYFDTLNIACTIHSSGFVGASQNTEDTPA